MTIEELEIIVDASIEPAIKEIRKLIPTIKQQVTQAVEVAQKSMEKVDMKSVSGKVEKAVQTIRKRIESLKKSNTDNNIKININNKEAQKQISQLEKEIDSLQKKITARQMKLEVITPRLDKITEQTTKDVTPAGISSEDPSIQPVIQNALKSNKEYSELAKQEAKLTQDIAMYNKQLDIARTKASQLKQELQGTSQNKLTSFFSTIKAKLDQIKGSASGFKNSFQQIPKITQKVTNNIKNMGSGLKSGLKHVLKYAMALFSLRGIYSVLSNSARAWLSSQNKGAQQLSANIDYLKYSMGSVFAPIIQTVVNLIYKLMKAIQSVVYAFSGINIFAKATASSMNKTAGSASKASKSLSGVHGEINNVSENNGGGGSATPSMDLTQMDTSMNTWAEKVKAKLTTLFQPIQNSWNTYGKPLMQSIQYAFSSKVELIKSIGKSFEEVWLNGTGEQTVSTILQILTSIFNICGNISTAFKQAWENNGGTEIVQNLWDGFNNILEIVKGVYQVFEEWTASESFQTFANSIISICQTLSGWFEKITGKLKEIWENGGKETFTKLLEFITKVSEAIDMALQVLTPVVDYILDIVTPVIEGIIKVIGYVIDALSGVLDFIIGIFTGDWERAWNGIKDFFIGIWNALKEIVNTVIETVKKVIQDALELIKNIWTTVWNGIWSTIKNIVNKILGGIEKFVNGTIKGINKLLSGISKVANAVGSLIGLNPINLQLSTISLPRLATGNVAYSETVAVFGEYSGARNNPEITTPQNIMRETFADVLSDYQFTNGNRQPIRVQIFWGAKAVVDEIIDGINEKTRQTGKAQIKVAYD